MAIGEHKNKSPYHGVFVASFFMIALPIAFYFLFRWVFFKTQTAQTPELNEATAKIVGFGIGVLFHISLAIVGVFNESLKIVKLRVAEFFENLHISFKFAWECYIEDIRENGVAFWILFGIVVVNICFFASGLSTVLQLYLK